MHSRRQFLALSTATAVGASLQLPLGIAREKAAQDPFGGWPIGVQSYSLRNFNLHQAVRHLQGLGVHHVELWQDADQPLNVRHHAHDAISKPHLCQQGCHGCGFHR